MCSSSLLISRSPMLLLLTFAVATTLLLTTAPTPTAALKAMTYTSYGPNINLTVQSSTLFGTTNAGFVATGNGAQNQAFSGDGDLFVTGRFNSPSNALLHAGKKRIYVNDRGFNYGALRVVDLNAGTISTVCGNNSQVNNATYMYRDGQCAMNAPIGFGGCLRWSQKQFDNYQAFMTLDVTRDFIYMIDPYDWSIHKVDMSVYNPSQNKGPMISTIVNANTSVVPTSCGPNAPALGVAFNQAWNPATFQLCRPTSLSVDEAKNILYIADAFYGGIVAINFGTNMVYSVLVNTNFQTSATNTTISFTTSQIGRVFYRPLTNSLMIGSQDTLTSYPPSNVLQTRIVLYSLTTQTYTYTTNWMVPLINKGGIYSYIPGPDDQSLFVHAAAHPTVSLYNFTSNKLIYVAGGAYPTKNVIQVLGSDVDGPWNTTWIGSAGAVNNMWYDAPTQSLYIPDKRFNRISKINIPTLMSSWVAGGGPTGIGMKDGTIATGGAMSSPTAVRYRAAKNSLLFIDQNTAKVREINLDGNEPNVTSLIGGGSIGYLHYDRCGFGTDPNTGKPITVSVGYNYQKTMMIGFPNIIVDPLFPENLFIPNMYCMIYYNATSNFISPIQFTNMPPIIRQPYPNDETGEAISDLIMTSDGLTLFQTLPWNHSLSTGLTPWQSVIVRNRVQSIPGTLANETRLTWDYTIICGQSHYMSLGQINGDCATTAMLGQAVVQGLALDEKNKRLYWAEAQNIRYLWPYDSDNPTVYKLLGNSGFADGNSVVAKFGSINSLVYTTFRGTPVFFLVDNYRDSIRMIDMTNMTDPQVYSIAGLQPSQAALVGAGQYVDGDDHEIRFNGIKHLVYDGDSKIFVAESGNAKIRVLTLFSPTVYNPPSSSSSGGTKSSTATSSTATSSTATSTATSSTGTSTGSTGASSTAASTATSTSTSSTAASSSTSTSSTSTDSSGGGTSSSISTTGSSTTDSTGINQSSSSSSTGNGDQLGSASSTQYSSMTTATVMILMSVFFGLVM